MFLGAHVFVSMRERRDALISQDRPRPLSGLFSLVSIVGLVLIGYGFARYRAEGVIPALVSAGMDAPHRGRADVAGEHRGRRRLHSRRHQARAQAPDAGRR